MLAGPKAPIQRQQIRPRYTATSSSTRHVYSVGVNVLLPSTISSQSDGQLPENFARSAHDIFMQLHDIKVAASLKGLPMSSVFSGPQVLGKRDMQHIIRLQLALMKPGVSDIKIHVDSGGYAIRGHRLHIPVFTHSEVSFDVCPHRYVPDPDHRPGPGEQHRMLDIQV